MTNFNSREIQLTLCEKCNLNCVYCYEHKKDSTIMDFELAKKIITEEFDYAKLKGIDSLSFSFHGGEIALVFDRLKEICEWIWSKEWGVKYSCSGATNGTLVHGDIQEWFEKNSQRFMLGLSLDGNRVMHNLNRSNSFDLIDLDFFLKTWPNSTVKMTISPMTLGNISEGIKFIVNKGFSVTANLAYGCDWSKDSLKIEYAKELLSLSDFFLKNPLLEPPKKLMQKSLLDLGFSVYTNKFEKPNRGCGSGKYMCCYDMVGNKLPCHLFMPSSAGDLKYRGSHISDEDIIFSKDCEMCPIYSVCFKCIGFNFTQYGDLKQRHSDMCDLEIIEWYNYTFFLYKMLESKDSYLYTKDLTEAEVGLILKAIVYLQKRIASSNIRKFIV